MTREDIRKWMKDNGISIHRLARYLGISVVHFNSVLNGKASLTTKTKEKVLTAMSLKDVSAIKDMAYLKIPFTRAEWKNIKYIFNDESYVARQVHDLVMQAVEHIANEQSTYLPELYTNLTQPEI